MLYALAILLPPLAVACTNRAGAFLLNIVLCLFGWIPAIVHALLVVSSHERRQAERRVVHAIEEQGPTVVVPFDATAAEIDAAMRTTAELARRQRAKRREVSARTTVVTLGIVFAIAWWILRSQAIDPAGTRNPTTARIGPSPISTGQARPTDGAVADDLPPPTPAAQPDGHRDTKNRDLAPME